MLPPNFTPAQSKMLHTAVALYLLLSTCTYIHSRTLVDAAELHAASPIDALSPSILPAPAGPGALPQLQDGDEDGDGDGGYAPVFDYFDWSLLGRQESQEPPVIELKNNKMEHMEINPGVTSYFVFKRSQSRLIRATDDALEAQDARGAGNTSGEIDDGGVDADDDGGDDGSGLDKRQAGNRIWISANSCRQPAGNGSEPLKVHPQLVMYVSTSSGNQKPGPNIKDGFVPPVPFDQGYASIDVNTSSDVYIGISAPNPSKDWTGSWSFDLAASVDGAYHSYNAFDPFLYMIDTDSESTLFITYDLVESNKTDISKWVEDNPFTMYAFEVGDQSAITGMERSVCALRDLYSNSTLNTTTTITKKFGGGLSKSQFHIQGLKNGTMYNGFLAVDGNKDTVRLPGGGTIRAGGMVFQNFTWTTKTDDSCQVLFDLDFCDSVAYAVPSSPEFKLDDDRLKALYDEQAENYYRNFRRSLAQVACNTTSEAQYSLARTCDDCAKDYKKWLCSVLIPRCEDWSAPDDWLQERNVNALLPDGSVTFGGNETAEIKEEKRDRFAFSKSRNPMIDEKIKPGPYKEMKPCEDLCFDIVRSCPAQLGFACPNSPARELSYGKRDPNMLKCNFPGAVVKLNVLNAAETLTAGLRTVGGVALAVTLLAWV